MKKKLAGTALVSTMAIAGLVASPAFAAPNANANAKAQAQAVVKADKGQKPAGVSRPVANLAAALNVDVATLQQALTLTWANLEGAQVTVDAQAQLEKTAAAFNIAPADLQAAITANTSAEGVIDWNAVALALNVNAVELQNAWTANATPAMTEAEGKITKEAFIAELARNLGLDPAVVAQAVDSLKPNFHAYRSGMLKTLPGMVITPAPAPTTQAPAPTTPAPTTSIPWETLTPATPIATPAPTETAPAPTEPVTPAPTAPTTSIPWETLTPATPIATPAPTETAPAPTDPAPTATTPVTSTWRLSDDVAVAAPGDVLMVDVLANDYPNPNSIFDARTLMLLDAQGTPVTSVTTAAGTFTVVNGQVEFTANTDAAPGTYSVEYVAQDSTGQLGTATLSVTIA